jgi:hemerythrin superfamily protein
LEHHVVETLLQEMSQLSSGDDQWQAKLSVVTENLEHHIKEEEEEIFPKAQTIISDEQAEELGEAFTAEKSKHLSTAA